ncbi:MAG: hypothetical protein PHS46_03995 [Candidatus Omnitrophica bacterium]|nr:hypothetical protein [Candidatus Omnitrophota bacterium]
MNYANFKKKVIKFPVIPAADLLLFEGKRQAARNQLNRWLNKGLVLKLRRGLYILNENDRKIDPSSRYLANQLYAPSYVSLEYALGFYGLIPERVRDVTSVTTKKTARFINIMGVFTYQHVKPEAFRGYTAVKDENGFDLLIASPEKAAIDFLYLSLDRIKKPNIDIFESSFRFQNTEELDCKKIIAMAALFKNKKLTKLARLFCEFIRKERQL